MSVASFVRLDAGWYAVRFTYDPDAVDAIKMLPGFARRWEPAQKYWKVDASFVNEAANQLKRLGYSIRGVESAKPGTKQQNWAELLFKRVGPDRTDSVYRALSRILHPDNATTGDKAMQQELNDAKSKL